MKKIALLPALLLAATSLFAAQTTTTGILTDDMCVRKHMLPGKSNAECVRECIKGGAKYVVVAGSKVLELQGKADQLDKLAGKKVTVTGEQKGNVIVVASVVAAE
jgi:hypothetical protein